MKKIWLFFFGLMLLSCSEKVVEKPENLIPKEKMVAILHDLAILNSARTSFKIDLEKTGIEVMPFIYKKHQIDSAQFSQSDLYYASVPLEYQSIYEQVESILEQRKDTLEGFTKKRNDSIRKAQQQKKETGIKTKNDKENAPDAS